MFDPKKLLTDLLDSNVPGTQGSVRDKAGQVGQLAKDNPLATGAIAAILLSIMEAALDMVSLPGRRGRTTRTASRPSRPARTQRANRTCSRPPPTRHSIPPPRRRARMNSRSHLSAR